MSEDLRAVSAIAVLLALILFAMLLKRIGLLEQAHGRVMSRIVTNVTLPAVVLVSLSRSRILWSDLDLALIMLGAGLVCLAIGWMITRLLRLQEKQAGAVILMTGFANTSMLGIALIAETFPDDRQDLAEAVMLSGIGSQPAIFLLGTLIAIHYGAADLPRAKRVRASLRYFHSPIFFAFAGGLALSMFVGPVSSPLYDKLLEALKVVGQANTFLVTLTVGLLLQLHGLGDAFRAASLVAPVKLLVMPFLAWLLASAFSPQAWQIDVLVLEAGMPSAMLAVALCSSYGCDDPLAAALVLATTTLSAITLPMVFAFLT